MVQRDDRILSVSTRPILKWCKHVHGCPDATLGRSQDHPHLIARGREFAESSWKRWSVPPADQSLTSISKWSSEGVSSDDIDRKRDSIAGPRRRSTILHWLERRMAAERRRAMADCVGSTSRACPSTMVRSNRQCPERASQSLARGRSQGSGERASIVLHNDGVDMTIVRQEEQTWPRRMGVVVAS